MKRYRYKVRTGKGAVMSGVLLAEHKGEALQVLKRNHDRILSLKEDWFSVRGASRHFSDEERERLFKELGILLKSEIPILRALEIMGLRGSEKVTLLCRQIGEELKKGRPLSKALLRHQQAIGPLAPVLLEAGEKSGRTSVLCLRLSDSYHRKREFRKELMGALFYPLVVMGVGGLVVLYFIIAVLPLFTGLYGDLNLSVPAGLTLMMTVRAAFTDHPLALVWVTLGLFLFHHAIRPYRLRLFLVIPPFRRAYGRFWEVRYVGLLALLLESDLSLHEALEEARNLLPMGPLRLEGQKLLRTVTGGESLSGAAFAAPFLISPLTWEFLSMGEESGRLPQMLSEASRLMTEELTLTLKTVKRLMEPVLLVFMAGVSVLILYGVMSPLMGLMNGLPTAI